MRPLTLIYRRLDRLQRTLWFRIVASVLALGLCAGFFGYLLGKSYSLDSQRRMLISALSEQNLNRRDPLAVSLKETGEVVVNNHRYGGPDFLNPRYPLFDSDGNIAEVPYLAMELLEDQWPANAPTWLIEQPDTTWMLALVTTTWLLLIVWMQITLPFLLTLIGTAIPALIAWWLNSPQSMLAFAGMGMLTFTYLLLTKTALLGLSQPYQLPAVAHTVLKEASRTRIALVFIVLLLVLLPLMPLWLDPASPLRFRIQTFISRSMGLTFTIAACMTLFLSCATVAFEIRDRQIWQLMTKPLGRMNYLLGKWLGIMVINMIILLIAGVSIFTFVKYLRTLPVAPDETGQLDLIAVSEEVLTARAGSLPRYQKMEPEFLRQRVNQFIEADPNLAAMPSVPLRKRLEIERQIEGEFTTAQRVVPGGAGKKYLFEGLKNAKRLNSTLTLRYRFHILSDDEHKTYPVVFQVFDADERPIYQRPPTSYVPTMTHSFALPAELIRDDGTLQVGIFNIYQSPEFPNGLSLNFDEGDLELLYKVDTFEGNFVRAVAITWVKLAFLAALGICCATFLSFPVACLLAFTIFLSGVIGPYLAEALEYYYPPETSQVDWSNLGMVMLWAFESLTRLVAQIIVFMLSSFGEVQPKQLLVEGRVIPWSAVAGGLTKLGVLWSGMAMSLGYLVMRKRQLAIYSGQG